jgi:hypothetical protein
MGRPAETLYNFKWVKIQPFVEIRAAEAPAVRCNPNEPHASDNAGVDTIAWSCAEFRRLRPD